MLPHGTSNLDYVHSHTLRDIVLQPGLLTLRPRRRLRDEPLPVQRVDVDARERASRGALGEPPRVDEDDAVDRLGELGKVRGRDDDVRDGLERQLVEVGEIEVDVGSVGGGDRIEGVEPDVWARRPKVSQTGSGGEGRGRVRTSVGRSSIS